MNDHVTLLFEPLDVLLLRDHRPFEMGQNVLARSTFPQPSVLRGALRTALMRHAGADFARGDEHFGVTAQWAQDLLGGRTRPGSLTLRGPLLARQTDRGIEPLFRKPGDLVKTDRGWQIQKPVDLTSLGTQRWQRQGKGMKTAGASLPWTEAEPQKHTGQLYLTRAGAAAYLEGDPKQLEVIADHQAPATEDRIGICRDFDTRTAAEGMFYVKRCFRLAQGYGFAVEADLAASTVNGWRDELEGALRALGGMIVPLGGKAHRASIHVFDAALFDLETPAGNGRTKLWLQTPAPAGWPGMSEDLVTMATTRPALVGGFDLARGQPRPLRRALPAGTVLYLDVEEPEKARDQLAETQTEDDRRAGYGVALAGRW
jgi:CRISPR-associated protein Cmr3